MAKILEVSLVILGSLLAVAIGYVIPDFLRTTDLDNSRRRFHSN